MFANIHLQNPNGLIEKYRLLQKENPVSNSINIYLI